jgi:hypothetical protein
MNNVTFSRRMAEAVEVMENAQRVRSWLVVSGGNSRSNDVD